MIIDWLLFTGMLVYMISLCAFLMGHHYLQVNKIYSQALPCWSWAKYISQHSDVKQMFLQLCLFSLYDDIYKSTAEADEVIGPFFKNIFNDEFRY